MAIRVILPISTTLKWKPLMAHVKSPFLQLDQYFELLMLELLLNAQEIIFTDFYCLLHIFSSTRMQKLKYNQIIHFFLLE